MLEAINGSKAAISRVSRKLNMNLLYKNAGINPIFIHPYYSTASIESRRCCLAHIAIDVLRSPRKDIRTVARIRVLELLYSFDVHAIADSLSFSQSGLGFRLPWNEQEEPIYDLIPQSFRQGPEEGGGTPHNDLFFKNAKIREIFEIQPACGVSVYNITSRINFVAGCFKLRQNHPAETVQILLSLLRLYQPYWVQ
jgi:hypothetical protein